MSQTNDPQNKSNSDPSTHEHNETPYKGNNKRQSRRINPPLKHLDDSTQVLKATGTTTASAPVTTLEKGSEDRKPQLELHHGARPGDRYIRFVRTQQPEDKTQNFISDGIQVIAWDTDGPATRWRRIKHLLLGTPLATARAAHERLGKIQALAILSSDALSSVAYATEAALFVLVMGFSQDKPQNFIVPISFAISLLIAIVVWSYRQTIHAYPNGGGSYIVAKDNLGINAGLLAAGALMIDYVLTVSVSVAAGVENFVSAVPDLRPYELLISIGLVFVLMVGNLRGVRESGIIFAIPTYFFILSFLAMLGVGLFQVLFTQHALIPFIEANQKVAEYNTQALGLVLILQAFASGCSAMTGVEAISNGVPAFRKPESKNAATTLVWMAALLIIFFMGTSFLAEQFQAHPNDSDTVISQLSRVVFGDNSIGYIVVTEIATPLILILAANTSFADFPRLASLLSRDKFLPHIFAHRGDRLAFSTGILALGGLAIVLLVIFGPNTQALIPLYAVGVFLAFTLSQSGMVVHWQKEKRKGGKAAQGATRSQLINGLGAICTGIVLVIIAASKFLSGAWLVVILIPILFAMFKMIHIHYRHVANQLRLSSHPVEQSSTVAETHNNSSDRSTNNLWLTSSTPYQLIVPIGDLNQVSLSTLQFAKALGPKVTAIHVSDDLEAINQFQLKWSGAKPEASLVILESPYRSVTRPLINYLDTIHERDKDEVLVVILPEFVARHWWENFLHNQTALRLKAAFLYRPGVAVMSVPYQLK